MTSEPKVGGRVTLLSVPWTIWVYAVAERLEASTCRSCGQVLPSPSPAQEEPSEAEKMDRERQR